MGFGVLGPDPDPAPFSAQLVGLYLWSVSSDRIQILLLPQLNWLDYTSDPWVRTGSRSLTLLLPQLNWLVVRFYLGSWCSDRIQILNPAPSSTQLVGCKIIPRIRAKTIRIRPSIKKNQIRIRPDQIHFQFFYSIWYISIKIDLIVTSNSAIRYIITFGVFSKNGSGSD